MNKLEKLKISWLRISPVEITQYCLPWTVLLFATECYILNRIILPKVYPTFEIPPRNVRNKIYITHSFLFDLRTRFYYHSLGLKDKLKI